MKTHATNEDSAVNPRCMVCFKNIVLTMYYFVSRKYLINGKYTIVPMWYERGKMLKLLTEDYNSYKATLFVKSKF